MPYRGGRTGTRRLRADGPLNARAAGVEGVRVRAVEALPGGRRVAAGVHGDLREARVLAGVRERLSDPITRCRRALADLGAGATHVERIGLALVEELPREDGI